MTSGSDRRACWGAALLALACATGCGGEDLSSPFIEIPELAPSMIIVGNDNADDARLVLHYIDPDGDIGGGRIELFDCRADAEPFIMEFPVVASDDAVEKGIELDGFLNVFLPNIELVERVVPSSCAAFADAELMAGELSYCMRVTDDSGNLSNGACSPIIAIDEP